MSINEHMVIYHFLLSGETSLAIGSVSNTFSSSTCRKKIKKILEQLQQQPPPPQQHEQQQTG